MNRVVDPATLLTVASPYDEQVRALAIVDALRALIVKAEASSLPAVALNLRLVLADILADTG